MTPDVAQVTSSQGRLHGKAMWSSIRSNVSRVAVSSQRCCLRVCLLNKEHLSIYVEGKATVHDVYTQVCEHLTLRETEYFGLAQKIDEEFHFVEDSARIQKLVPAAWKAAQRQTASPDEPILTLYFRVQFYVEHIGLLKERITRHLYYLQLRENLLDYRHQVSEEKCFVYAAYALQADFGNYHQEKHGIDYFDPREYFPAWVVQVHGGGYIGRSMPPMHEDLAGMTRLEAQMRFISELTAAPTAHNLHFYQLKKRKTDALGTAWLGISATGIGIYEDLNGFKNLLSSYIWSSIDKLYFQKKKFEVRAVGTADGRKFTYHTGSESRSCYLLARCRAAHTFHMRHLRPRLAELRHLAAEDRRFRELSADDGSGGGGSRRGGGGGGSGCYRRPSGGRAGVYSTQRISMISETSSNTTSGIASDVGKVYTSHDESEDDRSQEIIIDSPPRPVISQLTAQPVVLHAHPSAGPTFGLAPVQPLIHAANAPIQNLPADLSAVTGKQVARSASGLSQHQRAVATPMTAGRGKQVARSASGLCQRTDAVPRAPSSPVAAEAHFQRVTFAPTMTVVSGPVAPPGSIVTAQPYRSYPVRAVAPLHHACYAPDAIWTNSELVANGGDIYLPMSQPISHLDHIAAASHVTQMLPMAQMTPVSRMTPATHMASVSREAPVTQMTPISQQVAAPVVIKPPVTPPAVCSVMEPQSPTSSDCVDEYSERADDSSPSPPPSCPLHGVQQDVAAEIRGGLSNKNISLPLMKALYNDMPCTCQPPGGAAMDSRAKRMSCSFPAAPHTTTPRPLSWHNELLDHTLRAFDDAIGAAAVVQGGSETVADNAPATGGAAGVGNTTLPLFPISSSCHGTFGNGNALGPQKAGIGFA